MPLEIYGSLAHLASPPAHPWFRERDTSTSYRMEIRGISPQAVVLFISVVYLNRSMDRNLIEWSRSLILSSNFTCTCFEFGMITSCALNLGDDKL